MADRKSKSWWDKVNPHSLKCPQFAKAISEDEDDTFITFVGVVGTETNYFIRGKAYFVDDGDDHYDDMSGSEEIYYCPFCGGRL